MTWFTWLQTVWDNVYIKSRHSLLRPSGHRLMTKLVSFLMQTFFFATQPCVLRTCLTNSTPFSFHWFLLCCLQVCLTLPYQHSESFPSLNTSHRVCGRAGTSKNRSMLSNVTSALEIEPDLPAGMFQKSMWYNVHVHLGNSPSTIFGKARPLPTKNLMRWLDNRSVCFSI